MTYAPAALFIALSAALHLIALPLGAWEGFGWVFVAIAAYYAVLIAMLLRGWRWAAYLAYLCMLIGGVGAFAEVWRSDPAWAYAAIMGADFIAAALLFVPLWRGRPSGRMSAHA